MLKKIVLTGGTYAGKTSLLNLFRQEGYRAIPDIGFQFLTELNKELGQEQQKELRANNPLKFYRQIIERQIAAEAAMNEGVVVLDRGVYDYIAMMRLKNIEVPDLLNNHIRGELYDHVFVLDTLSTFDNRSHTGRSLTKEDSLTMNKLVTELYHDVGCEITVVKEMPVEERYAFIRSRM